MSDILTLGAPQPWMTDALCLQIDPELFYPEQGASNREGKRICAACDVRAECLAFAFARSEPYGIWGGLSARERWRVTRAARLTSAPAA